MRVQKTFLPECFEICAKFRTIAGEVTKDAKEAGTAALTAQEERLSLELACAATAHLLAE